MLNTIGYIISAIIWGVVVSYAAIHIVAAIIT
jgi:hypothetical protein